MMPLCTSASRPSALRCGCAFASVGPPWVAQRVCPIPVDAGGSGSSVERLLEVGQLAGPLVDAERAVGLDDDPGGVVAAVLQPAQPLEHDVQGVACRQLDRCTRRFHTCAARVALPAVARRQRRQPAHPVRRARPRGVGGTARPDPPDPQRARARAPAGSGRPRRPGRGRGGLPAAVPAAQPVRRRRRPAARRHPGLPGERHDRVPFVIGVAGSVAVGKSTTARVLRDLLAALAGDPVRRAGHHRRVPAAQRRARAARPAAAQGLPGVLRPARAAALRGRGEVRAGRGRARRCTRT